MNEASVLELLFNVRIFDNWSPVQTMWGGKRTAGFFDYPRQRFRYAGPPNTVNGIFEVCERIHVTPYRNPPGTLVVDWNLPTTVRQLQNRGTWPSEAGEAYQGIELGSFALNPPWQTTYTSSSGYGVIQLRWAEVLERWELCVFDGDTGLAPTITPCDVQPGWIIDSGQADLKLEWLPNVSSPTLTSVRAYINSVLVHTLTGGRLANFINTQMDFYGTGYFVTRGSDISFAGLDDCGFGPGYIYTPFEWTP